MNPVNPEIQFRTRFKPDYTGMTLTELEFGTMRNHKGEMQTYKLDLITPPTLPEKPMPVVIFVHGDDFAWEYVAYEFGIERIERTRLAGKDKFVAASAHDERS